VSAFLRLLNQSGVSKCYKRIIVFLLLFFFFLGKGNEEEGKQKVAQIHDMKERLKQENDALKKLKQGLKDVQEKQKNEKEVPLLLPSELNNYPNLKTVL